jgi:hypothetical protein
MDGPGQGGVPGDLSGVTVSPGLGMQFATDVEPGIQRPASGYGIDARLVEDGCVPLGLSGLWAAREDLCGSFHRVLPGGVGSLPGEIRYGTDGFPIAACNDEHLSTGCASDAERVQSGPDRRSIACTEGGFLRRFDGKDKVRSIWG